MCGIVISQDNKCYWLPSSFAVTSAGKVPIESYINDLDPGMHGVIAGAFETLLPMFERALQARDQPQPQRLSQFRAKRIFENEYPIKWTDKQCSMCLRSCDPVFAVVDSSVLLCRTCCNVRLARDAIVRRDRPFLRLNYSANDLAYNLVQLVQPVTPLPTFLRGRNLRVVTRMSDIYLTPENPMYK
ncbi:hypothetical protein BJ741DRAFT_711674, partial [Chytriomyces cf. hyalinus JEL632]